jgi:hypothetical protein
VIQGLPIFVKRKMGLGPYAQGWCAGMEDILSKPVFHHELHILHPSHELSAYTSPSRLPIYTMNLIA